MDISTGNCITEPHALNMDSNPNSSQVAAEEDGSQAEIITMDDWVYKAAAEGNVHLLKQMSEDDLQFQLSPKGNTVLHIASQYGQLSCVEWILGLPSCSSLLQRPNLQGDTPLHLAAREGYLMLVRALIDAAREFPPDVESGIGAEKAILRMSNKEKDTAMHEAVRYHHSDVVKLLIMEDPQYIYGENLSGGTPLYMAAERGFGDLVQIIIDDTCSSPAYTGFDGRTALHAAVIRNNQEMTKKITEWEPALTKQVDANGWSPLHFAAYLGCNLAIVMLLLKKSDKPVAYLRIKDGKKTAIHLAASRGHMQIVKLLASHSPNCCEQVDEKGNNVFHFAMMGKKAFPTGGILNNSWLRVRGLMNEKDAQGDTPFHLLLSNQVYDPFFIRHHKVDKMAVNNQNLTAGDILSRAGDIEGAKGLIQAKLNMGREVSVGALRWQREKEKQEEGGSESKGNEDNKGPKHQHKSERYMKASKSHLIVAALLATVAFAAGFTLPGGYNDNDGMATLTKKAAFKAFIVLDTLAMTLSVSAVFVYFFMSWHQKKLFFANPIIEGSLLTMLAMGATVLAFLTGFYAVLPHSGLLICISVISCFFFLIFYAEFYQFSYLYKVRIRIYKGGFSIGCH